MAPKILDNEWLAADAENQQDRWMHHLSTEEIEDIAYALQYTKTKGHTGCETMTKEDFPLRSSEPTLELLLDRVENDMGMFVIRGLPTERFTKADMRMIYWGLGLNLGTAVSQSRQGDMLGDVKNFGDHHDPASAGGRGYMSKMNLGFHTDSSDLVALIVLNSGVKGGESMICSSVAVHNEIARRRPDLLEVLYEPFFWSWKGNSPPGYGPYYKLPIFMNEKGRFSSRFVTTHIQSAQDFEGIPKLTEKQKEAMQFVHDVANEEKFHFRMMFKPGDIQILNNHLCYHARTEFEDGETEDKKRHLLRMWLSPTNSRKLCDQAAGFFQKSDAGVVRGGFPPEGTNRTFETKVTTD